MSQLLNFALALVFLFVSTHGQNQVQYEICKNSVINPNLQRFSIISPGFGNPAGYPSNVRCHIDYAMTKTPRILRVTFSNFRLEKGEKCQKDSLRIGSTAILCGAWPQGRTMDFLVMPGKTFMFSFNTDSNINDSGFKLDVQVGNYNPGQMVKVYSGRGDYYTQDYTNTVCSCGTNQGSALAQKYNYQQKCNCKLTHDHNAPKSGFGQRMKSFGKQMLNTLAAGTLFNGLNKMNNKPSNIAIPKSNPYTVQTMQSQQPQGSRSMFSLQTQGIGSMFSPQLLQAMALSKLMKKGGSGGEAAEGGAMGDLFNMGGSGAETETEGGSGSSGGFGGLFKNLFGRQNPMFGSQWMSQSTTAKPESEGMGLSGGMNEDDDESSSSLNSQPSMNFLGRSQGYPGASVYSAFPRNNQYRQLQANLFAPNNNGYRSNGFGGFNSGSRYPQQTPYQQRAPMQNMQNMQSLQGYYGQSAWQQAAGGEAQTQPEIATHEAAPGGERD